MKTLCYTLLSVFAFNSFAQTCDESKSVNLTDKGSSLENLRTTDQNGLGICHIEQLHKMLKAKIPGSPDLARVQLAIAEKKQRDIEKTDKKAVRWMSPDLKSGGTYIDAGNSCEAYKLIKGADICLSSNDQFEQLTDLEPNRQQEIMHRLATYFDANKKSPSNEILGLLKDFGPSLENGWKSCNVDQEVFDKFKNSYTLYLMGDAVSNKHRFKKSFKVTLPLAANDLMLTAADILEGKTFSQKVFEQYKLMSEAPQEVLNAYYELLASYKKTETCMLDQIKTVNQDLYCAPIGTTDTRVIELNKFGMGMSDIVRILKGDSDRDQFFGDVFKCAGNQKVKIPEMNCRDVNLLTLAKAATNLDEYHQLVASKLDEQLAQGTPIGISTCTRWFRNPNVKSVHIGEGIYKCGDKTDPDYKNGEGSHAVTVIGSRCRNGVQEYLIQNSWGSGCFYHKDFECTKKGGFWAPVSSVVNNIRTLNYLE